MHIALYDLTYLHNSNALSGLFLALLQGGEHPEHAYAAHAQPAKPLRVNGLSSQHNFVCLRRQQQQQ